MYEQGEGEEMSNGEEKLKVSEARTAVAVVVAIGLEEDGDRKRGTRAQTRKEKELQGAARLEGGEEGTRMTKERVEGEKRGKGA